GAQALEAPLPGEPAHDAFQVSDREARALELGHQLLAPPELVVDRVIMRVPRAVRPGDQAVLRVEHEVRAGLEDAPELGVEPLPARRLEAAAEAAAEGEGAGPGREAQRG